ncbi:MAG: transposase [Saprospiraceae bacterium]|nr:transposase [Saprospiraceae bacterium]
MKYPPQDKWLDKVESIGESSLEGLHAPELRRENKKLIAENKQPKEMNADKELKIMLMERLLKKVTTMEEKTVGTRIYRRRHPQDTVLRHLMIPRSTYYYKPPQGIKSKGRPVSSHTMKKDQTWATNEEVISDIKEILSEEFVDYGYLKTTHALRQQCGYIISPKKVYRLMEENKLLNHPTKPKLSKRLGSKS